MVEEFPIVEWLGFVIESYFRRLRRFFDAIDLCKDMGMEQCCNTFAYRARTDYNWAFNHILRFLQSQKE
jgi:hypothetical protein